MADRHFFVRGVIDAANAPALKARLRVLVAMTDDDLILECKYLEFIDSVGVSILMDAHDELAAQGRACRIVNLSNRIRRSFERLGLTERFDIALLDQA